MEIIWMNLETSRLIYDKLYNIEIDLNKKKKIVLDLAKVHYKIGDFLSIND
jgi:hypothetical protein